MSNRVNNIKEALGEMYEGHGIRASANQKYVNQQIEALAGEKAAIFAMSMFRQTSIVGQMRVAAAMMSVHSDDSKATDDLLKSFDSAVGEITELQRVTTQAMLEELAPSKVIAAQVFTMLCELVNRDHEMMTELLITGLERVIKEA